MSGVEWKCLLAKGIDLDIEAGFAASDLCSGLSVLDAIVLDAMAVDDARLYRRAVGISIVLVSLFDLFVMTFRDRRRSFVTSMM